MILLIGQAGFVFLILSMRETLVSSLNETIVFISLYQGVLLILSVFFVMFSYSKNIKKPILALNAALSKTDAGDLTVINKPADNPEIELLVKGFNTLITRLKDTQQKLFSTTNDVTMAVNQVNMILEKVTKGTHDQASATAEVIIAMDGTDKFQKEISDNTQNLEEFSDENLSSLMEIKATSEEINRSAGELYDTSSTAYSAVAEISDAAKSIAKSIQELAISTEQVSASIEEINANTKEVENSTRESAGLALSVRNIASDRGMITVADAMGGMDEIIDSVSRTLQLVRNLEVKSKDIEKVLTVMADVTKQTNLLSVNAAILASQAGEYGKGFAVVADEIKTLADKTASSSKEIIDIIKSIRSGISEVTMVSENSKLIAEKGNTLVVKTGEAFNDVIEHAQKSSEMSKAIQNATIEQVRGVSQINESMEMVRVVVVDVSKSTHEHDLGSENLINIAEKVKEVSEAIKRSMQEQTAGISLISRNLELTNEKIKGIGDASKRHGKANEGIMKAASTIGDICNNTLRIADEMSVSFKTLYKEAESLKKDMEKI